MPKKYVVTLTEQERTELLSQTRKGHLSTRELKRIQILLMVDDGKENVEISEALHVSLPTISRVRKRFVQGGIGAARKDRPRPGAEPVLDGRQEAVLIAQACADPPEGRAKWTMQLLADRLVELKVVESISDETVRRVLKKVRSNPGSDGSGALPR